MRSRTLTFLLILAVQSLSAQNLQIPYGQVSPIVDGNFQQAEWIGSDSVDITISSGVMTRVFFKHDNSSLYVAFAGNLSTSGFPYFPEVMIDAQNDKTTSYQSGDWWFHVSASDCEYNGQYGNYDSCQVVRPNWLGAPNFSQQNPVDTVEIEIPFSTIGVNTSDTTGILFMLNNFSTPKKYPIGSNQMNPSTWATASFSFLTSVPKSLVDQEEFLLYPNPSNGNFTLRISTSNESSCNVNVVNSQGKCIYNKRLENSNGAIEEEIDLSNYSKGVYFFTINSGEKVLSKTVTVQ